MARITLGLLLAVSLTASAAAADRTDRIPSSVGPDDYRAYYVNPATPPGVDSLRWQSIAQRTLARWGATYLGTTGASPDDHEDGLNVIGFADIPDQGVLGRNTKGKGGIKRRRADGDSCAALPNAAVTEAVTPLEQTVRLRLRSDRVRRGKVRKRTVTVRRTIRTARVDQQPVAGQRCRTTTSTFESDPATVQHESDVQMDTQPPAPWYTGTDHPGAGEIDLETVLLHELGHAAGLDHQAQECDPSTPMYFSTSNGDYWRGTDEVAFTGCGALTVTPDPPAGAEGPFGSASLGGMAFAVNPSVPPGYDSGRFVALAQNIVERWGGAYAGTTAARPTQGDGQNVIGFDVIAGVDYELTTFTSQERDVIPPLADCAITTGPVSSFRVKKVTRRQRVRVRGRRRTLKLRRDRVVERKAPGPAAGRCAPVAARTDVRPAVRELDLGIAHEMAAYELGPRHPVQQTRVDMATLLADALGRAAGAPVTDPCALSSPVADDLLPGDWWRSPGDVQRLGCGAPRPGLRSYSRAGRERHVLTRD